MPSGATSTRTTLGATPAARARALADRATLGVWVASIESQDQAQQAVVIAREVDDTALLIRRSQRAATSPPTSTRTRPGRTWPRQAGWPGGLGYGWRLSQILVAQVVVALVARDPIAALCGCRGGTRSRRCDRRPVRRASVPPVPRQSHK